MIWRGCQNSFASSSDDPLIALTNPTTGAQIPNMPDSSDAITRMAGKQSDFLYSFFAVLTVLLAPQIRAVLGGLGQTVPANQPGGVILLRRYLRVQIGLLAEQL